jgi:hypothetical protein
MKHATTTTARQVTAATSAGLGLPMLACLWIGLVAIGVFGRLWQPGWNVTPMAGIALAAGALFANPLVAAAAPLAALLLGNLFLPGYGSTAMAAVVWAATVWPVVLGRWVVPAAGSRTGRWIALVGGALASSLVFFLMTNLAHWWLTSDYPHTFSGLTACFVAALPFYRWMPVGDVAWTVAIFAGLSAVTAAVQASRTATAA